MRKSVMLYEAVSLCVHVLRGRGVFTLCDPNCRLSETKFSPFMIESGAITSSGSCYLLLSKVFQE